MSDDTGTAAGDGESRREWLRMTVEEFAIELVTKAGYAPDDVAAELLRAERIIRTGKVDG